MTQKRKDVFYGISVKIWLHNIDQMARAPFSAGGYSMSYGLLKKKKIHYQLPLIIVSKYCSSIKTILKTHNIPQHKEK